MDDLEFRRRCIVDPFDQDEDFLRKKQQDPEHARFARHQEQFDRNLKATMESVVVPEGLAARVLLRHSLQQRKVRRRTWIRSVALAASILMAVGIGLVFNASRTNLQEIVLAHVYTELDHLNDRKDVQMHDLDTILRKAGHSLEEDLGRVHYANICHIWKRDGVHLVVQGEIGPVTVLLMPGEHITQRTVVSDERFNGVITPTPDGSMAILGEEGEVIQTIEEKVRSSVRWDT